MSSKSLSTSYSFCLISFLHIPSLQFTYPCLPNGNGVIKSASLYFAFSGGSSDCKNYSTLLEAAVNLDQRLHIEPMVVTVHDLKDLPNGVTVSAFQMWLYVV